MTHTRLNYLLGLIIIFSFVVGFIFQENSSGGANDFFHYLDNLELFYNSDFFEIDWIKYDSTSLPLYYFTAFFLYNSENLILLKIFHLFISIFSVYLFYKILNKKLNLEKSIIFLLSTSLLLSPYFRTSTFWMMEENFPILMTLLTIYFYLNLKKEFNYFNLFLVIFFSACAFFSRQNYIFVGFGLFFLIYDWKLFFSKKNFFIISLYLIFFSPILYFIKVWGGLLPPLVAEQGRVFNINFNNIPYIMNIILIYLVPFLYFEKKNIIIYLNRYKFLIVISFLIYISLFYSFIPSNFGGGALNKIFFIIFSGSILKFFLLFFSFLSFLILLILFRNNKFIILFFAVNILIFSNITPVWQEYFDPLSLIFLIIFGNKLMLPKLSLNFTYILILYLGLFLGASIIDQNFISKY